MRRSALRWSFAILLAACSGAHHDGDGFLVGDGGPAHHGSESDGGSADDAGVALNAPFFTVAFDTWSLGLVLVTSNGARAESYSAAIDQATLYDGAPTLAITPQGATVYDCGYLYESPSSLAPFLGRRIRMTAAVKTELDPESFAALIFEDFDDNTELTVDDMSNRRITGTTGFTSYSLVLDISAQTTDIDFGIGVCGTGPVWLSPPVFEVVPDSVPVTATYTSP